MAFIKLKKEGIVRVLNGAEGMTFMVDKFTDGERGKVAHVRDYRYKNTDERPYQIWSIDAGGYEYVPAPPTDDVTIMWGNKATYNRHKVAIDVQDAVNLRALAREFVKVVDNAMDEHNNTSKVWSDDAVRLFVNKFESLCHSEATFSEAYKVCQEKADT